MADNDCITLIEVIENDDLLREAATAVLGGTDTSSCTYSEGYIKRQPLYSCVTCTPQGSAGICLACSYECHDGHELIELYTKRHFRCDCGNSQFEDKCKLCIDKDSTNAKNAYNHNFKGNYCRCDKPYPDPEVEEDDQEMMQCTICEDWFHSGHLDVDVVPDDFEELVCSGCMTKNDFLWSYQCNKQSDGHDVAAVTAAEQPSPKRQRLVCYLEASKRQPNCSGSTFWPVGWRDGLCRCETCIKMYEDAKVSFLLSPEDTILHYETEAKKKDEENYDVGLSSFLGKLDRFTQVELLHRYNDFKNELVDYLRQLNNDGTVISNDHIHDFFRKIKDKKGC